MSTVDGATIRNGQPGINLSEPLVRVPGVAEVATIGGFQNQYQVTVDREKLNAYQISILQVAEAVAVPVAAGGEVFEGEAVVVEEYRAETQRLPTGDREPQDQPGR